MTKQYTPQEILALPMLENDANASTIGQYFTALLHTLWIENEGFSGKRPFGNSGWESDIEKALIRADAIEGSLDEDGYIDDCDSAVASEIVMSTLRFLHTADWKTVTEYKEPEDWYVVLLDTNSNGAPVIADSFAVGFTEKVAKAKVEYRKFTDSAVNWVAIQIPQ